MTNPYDAAHRRAAAACIAAHPQCAWCGTTTDLVADHIVPGRPEYGYQTLCRPDNTRRRHGATGPATPPGGPSP